MTQEVAATQLGSAIRGSPAARRDALQPAVKARGQALHRARIARGQVFVLGCIFIEVIKLKPLATIAAEELEVVFDDCQLIA
jgi:hypothetical protein